MIKWDSVVQWGHWLSSAIGQGFRLCSGWGYWLCSLVPQSLAGLWGWTESPTVLYDQSRPQSVPHSWVGSLAEDPHQTEMLAVLSGQKNSWLGFIGGRSHWWLSLGEVTTWDVVPLPRFTCRPLWAPPPCMFPLLPSGLDLSVPTPMFSNA